MVNLLMMIARTKPNGLERLFNTIPPLAWLLAIVGLPVALIAIRCLLFVRRLNQHHDRQAGFQITTMKHRK